MNQVKASVTYNHVIEGSLALTGYYAWQKVCTKRAMLPGMLELIKRIGDDERRHMAWGTFTCRRHVAADDANWNVMIARMAELMPTALAMIQWVDNQFEEQPFGLDVAEFIAYAADRGQRRLAAIESARAPGRGDRPRLLPRRPGGPVRRRGRGGDVGGGEVGGDGEVGGGGEVGGAPRHPTRGRGRAGRRRVWRAAAANGVRGDSGRVTAGLRGPLTTVFAREGSPQ